MSLLCDAIQLTNGRSCVLFDQRTMYAVGPDSSAPPTLEINKNYNFNNAYLFYASGGSILYQIEGTDRNGNTFGYQDESTAGTGNAGYYVNGRNVCPWVSGIGGVYRVLLLIDAYGTLSVIRLNWNNTNPGDFINGTNAGGDSFTDEIAGWNRMVKVNFNGSAGKVQLRVNNPDSASGSAYWRVFQWGLEYTTFANVITNYTPVPVDPDDPYSGGGFSDEGGGDGNFSEDSDAVDADPMPDESLYGATSCGLISIFSPTKTQLKRLADVIMGVGFWNFVQNTIQNISDLFVSLAVVPFTVDKGNTVEVTWWGYVDTPGSTGTGIYLTLAAKQWYEFDMGAISLKGNDSRIFKYGSVLDYSPYSRLGIYLPFIGYQELDIDECRDQVLYLRYRIDILSGTCVALISLRPFTEDPQSAKTIYQFSGNCLTQYPLTSVDASGMITNAVNIGIAGLSAGATAAIASAGDALTAENLTDPNKHLTAAGAEVQNKQHAAMVANSAGSLVGASVNGVMGMKPNYKKSGAISSSASLFGVKQPYLFLTTPRQSYPQNYAKYCGFPSNITGRLGSFSGYTVVEDIRLNGLVATSSEVEEIYALLKSGVIV